MDRPTRRRWLYWVGAAGICALAGAVTLVLGDPPPPRKIRLATGDPDGAYFELGNQLAEILRRQGLVVEVLSTTGSVQNAELLSARQADVAFAHAGIASKTPVDRLRTVARVYSEPIWVFYRAARPIARLTDIVRAPGEPKLRISIGADGSGSQVVALDLLRASGISDEHADLVRLDQAASVDAMRRGEIDVLIKSAAPTAPSVHALLHMSEVRLLDFPNHKAYTRRLRYLQSIAIEPGMLSVVDDMPPTPIWLLASTAALLTQEDTHPRVVELVLKAATELFGAGNLLDAAGEFPSARGLEIPQHEAAERMMKEGESWWSQNLSFSTLWLLSRAKVFLLPLLAVLPMIRLLPLILGLGSRRAINKRYQSLQKVERALRTATTRPEYLAAVEEGRRLEEEVRLLAAEMPAAYAPLAYAFRVHADFVLDEAEDRLAAIGEGAALPTWDAP